MPPRAIVRLLLARLGDRSSIHAIDIGKPPPRRVTRGVFPGKRPPKDALWAYIDAPLAWIDASVHPTPARVRAYALAHWETELVGGALRDEFCRAGGPTLAGWTISGKGIDGGVSDGTFALNQRFPNLSPAKFRARAALAGKKFGFKVESIQFLRPRELAPIVLVSTTRDRKKFIQDVPSIVEVLNPQALSDHNMAVTFEGLFFEARDAKGPFVRVNDSYRGEMAGSQWSAESGAYPYAHG
jgi:hypothetical protein